MKLKSILMAGICSLALGSIANAFTAGTVIRFTGSTAYRDALHAAIVHSYDAGTCIGGVNGSYDYIFNGTINSTHVTFVCHWTGSEQAVLSLSSKVPANKLSFIDESKIADGVLGSISTTAGTKLDPSGLFTINNSIGTIPTIAAQTMVSAYPDAGMTDTYQGSSNYRSKSKGYNPLVSGYSGDTNGIVGVVVFKWIALPGTAASFNVTNITAQQVRSALNNGAALDASFWDATKNPAGTNTVYVTGRDIMSGTRLTAFAESGFGATKSVQQWFPYNSTPAAATTGDPAFVKTVGRAINNITQIASDAGTAGGYGSGGDLCKGMANTNNVSNATLIGYAGTADADKSGGTQGITAGCEELSYNGIKLGVYSGSTFQYNDWNKVMNGTYSFWGYEHCYTAGDLTADQTTQLGVVINQLANGGSTFTSPDALPPFLMSVNGGPSMNVSRPLDGDIIN